MGNLIGQGAWCQIKIRKPTNTSSSLNRTIFNRSYGAMTVTLSYLSGIESLKLQCLDTWWYVVGVGRVQMSIQVSPKMAYLGINSYE